MSSLEDIIQGWHQRHYMCNKCGRDFTIASNPSHDDGNDHLETSICECGAKGDYSRVSTLPPSAAEVK